MATTQTTRHALPVILERLHSAYPGARYELDWETPLQLLVATILAAQCTDERVNTVTPGLFRKYPDAKAYAEADLAGLEEDLRPTGFYRQKAKTVQAVCRALLERHGGDVPASMADMVALPGVARKTANVVLNHAYDMPTGVIVDTHVTRLAKRMGLSDRKKGEQIEADLMALVPQDERIFFGPAMVLLGRYVCTHRAPDCEACVMADLCPKIGVGEDEEGDEDGDDTPEPESEAVPTKKKPAKKSPPAKAAPKVAVPSLKDMIPTDWREALKAEFAKPYFPKLEAFVAEQRAAHTVYPAPDEVFAALAATPLDKVRVVLLGQDPYPGAGEAHGLSFSVKPGVKIPASLVNIFRELKDDQGVETPTSGCLRAWADRGVLLLNTALTVRAGEIGSHRDQGWETFTDAVIRAVNARATPAVFLLWGVPAKKKAELVDAKKHRVVACAHPSPLSAKNFFGSRPFAAVNKALAELGQGAMDWSLTGDASVKGPTVREGVAGTPANDHAPAVGAAQAPSATTHALADARACDAKASLSDLLPESWRPVFADLLRTPAFRTLDAFVASERADAVVCPAPENVFAALERTPLKSVRVVLLGTEPPAFEEVADGLAFSAREGSEPSDALRTIFAELRRDLGVRRPVTGHLAEWARQGVLLLNLSLTVRAGRPGSHEGKWDRVVDTILSALNDSPEPIVFVLPGAKAAKKSKAIDNPRHAVIVAPHPGQSPDEVLGSGLFSRVNDELEMRGRSGVSWQLPYA